MDTQECKDNSYITLGNLKEYDKLITTIPSELITISCDNIAVAEDIHILGISFAELVKRVEKLEGKIDDTISFKRVF